MMQYEIYDSGVHDRMDLTSVSIVIIIIITIIIIIIITIIIISLL